MFAQDELTYYDDYSGETVYAPVEITYDPTLWTGEQVGGEYYAPYTVTYDPALWTGEQVGGIAQSGGFLDIFKSIFGVVSPAIQSVLKSTGVSLPTTTTAQTAAQVAATQAAAKSPTLTGSIASLTSSPLLLISLAVGGYMLIRRRGKKGKGNGKRKGRR
jgi:hypothetical protein